MRVSPLRVLAALWAGALSLDAQTVTIATDRASAVYATGETVRWQVTVSNAGSFTTPTYSIKAGGLTAVASGALSLVDGKATLDAKLDQPGWLLLEVAGKGATGTNIQSFGGAMVAPEQITPADPRPADFDAFWQAKLDELAAVPINASVVAGTSDRAGVDYATITLDCIRGTHVQGQLARPTTGAKFPALLIVQWAGVYSLQKSWATSRAAEGWLVLNTQAHDITPIESEAYYTALNNGALNNYPRIGNEDRETSYFLRMYLACHRAAEYLTTRPDWDGRTLVVMGGSQGGLQALVAAALHPKVTAALAEVPAGSDQAGLDAGRVPGWPVWPNQAWGRDAAKVRATARYFDVTHFIPRIDCPVLMGVGFIDTIVPPPGVYASYNLLTGARQMVAMPAADHQNGHAPYYTAQNAWLADARTGRAPTIQTAPQPVAAQAGQRVTLSVVAANGQAFGYQWTRDGVALPGATGEQLVIPSISTDLAGDYAVVVTSPGGTATSPSARVSVAGDTATAAPQISTQPLGAIQTEGSALELRVQASGGALRFQWRRDGAALPGATGATLRLAASTTGDSGLYDCVVSNALGSTVTETVAVTIRRGAGRAMPAVPTGGRLVDIAARAYVGTGADQLIGGVVVQGGPARLLVRAVGPGLAAQGVGNFLRDPRVDAFTATGTKFAANNDWGDGTAGASGAEIAAAALGAGAFALESGSRDACLLLTVDAGAYTFMVSGHDGGTGVGLVEIYILKSALPGYLVDLAGRARSSGGGNALFGGVVVSGPTQVLLRGVGPALADQNIGDYLRRPAMGVFNAFGAKVDDVVNWSATYSYSEASALFSRLGAFPLTFGSADAITVMNLSDADPIRSFQVQGADDGSGVALVEVYLVHP